MAAFSRPRLPLFLPLNLKQSSLYAAPGVFALLIFFVGTPLQADADSSLPTSTLHYSVPGKPTVNATLIDQVLFAYHSPVAGKGQVLYDDGVKYGIDPVFALAFFLQESTFGTAGVAQVTHSLGNIRCSPGYPSCYHGYRKYTNWEDSFLDWYNLIRDVYVASGLTTVEQIIPVYAPATENDVHAYIATVEQAVDTWRAAARNARGPWSKQEITVQQSTAQQRTVQKRPVQKRPVPRKPVPRRPVQQSTVQKVTVPLQIIPEPGQSQDDGQPVQLP